MRRIRTKQRRGANAIEFALTLPIFVAITFGMMEFGWFFSRVALLNSAVMDGCREGGLIDEDETGSDPGVTAVNRMTTRLTSGGLACTSCTAQVTGAVPNKVVECNATIDYDGLTGYFTGLGVMPSDITTSTQTRLEWQRND